MKLIVIGPPFPFEGEADLLNEMFALGMEMHHIRSPFIDLDVQRKAIAGIDEAYHDRVVIHQHYECANEFKIAGIHLPEKNRLKLEENYSEYTPWLERKKSDKDFHLSSSFHDPDTLENCELPLNYAFIGPVFESISKQYYAASFSKAALARGIDQAKVPVVAIGGIMPERIEEISKMNVHGVGTLGYIWKNENPVEAFKTLKETCSQFHTS